MKQNKENRIMRQTEKLDHDDITVRLFITLSAACLLSTFLFDKTKDLNTFAVAVAGLCMIVEAAVFLAVNKKLTYENMFILLFAGGFMIRLYYVLYTPVTWRQHDLWGFGSGMGHAGYIEHFYNEGFKLPDFNPISVNQFYHPPVHHFIAGMWLRFLTMIGMSYERAVSSLQYLTLFYSSCCMLVGERILNSMKIHGMGKITAFSIIAFHPSFIMLAGSVNNDTLSTLFVLLAIYTTIKWYNDSNVKNILLVALSIGLGMTTKLSVALIAFPVAFVFLVKFINVIKNKCGWLSYFKQYCIFAVVCIPLGMWFALRNYLVYNVPLNYVMRLSNNMAQYVGNWSVKDRLFDFGVHSFEKPYICWSDLGDLYSEYNVTVSLLKTSMFGAFNFENYNVNVALPARVLLWINIFLVIMSVVAMVYCLVKLIKNGCFNIVLTIFLAFYQILIFVNFVVFSFQYPHTCSMHYRYIVPTCVVGSAFIGMLINYFDCKDHKGEIKAGIIKNLYTAFKYIVMSAVIVFDIFALTVFIMIA